MKQFLSRIGKKAANGIVTGLFLMLTVASITYALNYNWSDPTSIRNRTAGNPLTSAGWNLLVGNVDNLNERLSNAEGSGGIVPTGAVMAFNLANCPNGWSPADGTNGRPDLRGEFIRGLDSGRGIDAGRALGSWQIDMFKSHTHTFSLSNPWATNLMTPYGTNPGVAEQATNPTGGTETRPRNVAFLYCIKS